MPQNHRKTESTLRFFALMSILVCLLIPEIRGAELKRPMQGIRNLGMGNVGVALSHDENALFYNPAGLAGVDAIIVSIPYVNEVSPDTISVLKDISQLSSSSSTSDTVKLIMGKTIHYRTLVGLNVIIPFGDLITFGAMSGYELSLDMAASNPVSIQLAWGNRLDKVTNVGMAFSLGRGRWLLGVGAEVYERCDYPNTTIAIGTLLNSSTLSDDIGFCSTSLMRKGQTYNLGFQKRMTSLSTLRMVWGVSARNVGGLKFARNDNETNPIDQTPEYNIGIAMTPFNTSFFRNFYELDIRDLDFQHADDAYCQENRAASDCNTKRLHIGTEFGFGPIDSGASALAIRFGWSQGYSSHGFELNPFIFIRGLTIQYADYRVETGDSAGESPERRRALQINLGF